MYNVHYIIEVMLSTNLYSVPSKNYKGYYIYVISFIQCLNKLLILNPRNWTSLFIVTNFDKFQCINFVVSKHVKIKFIIVVNFYGHMFRNPLKKIKSDFVLGFRHISISILHQIRIQLVGKFRSSKNHIQIF